MDEVHVCVTEVDRGWTEVRSGLETVSPWSTHPWSTPGPPLVHLVRRSRRQRRNAYSCKEVVRIT